LRAQPDEGHIIAIILGYDENLGIAKKNCSSPHLKIFSNFRKLTKVKGPFIINRDLP
jgi:hypothetical protein